MFLHADFDSIYMEFLTVLTTETLTETVPTMPLYILFAKGFLCCHDIIDTTKQCHLLDQQKRDKGLLTVLGFSHKLQPCRKYTCFPFNFKKVHDQMTNIIENEAVF